MHCHQHYILPCLNRKFSRHQNLTLNAIYATLISWPRNLVNSLLAIEHSPRYFSFGLAYPLLSIFGLNTPVFFLFYQLLLPNFAFIIIYNPLPALNVQYLSLPYVFLSSCFIIISFSNPNVHHVFFFFISAIQISHRIKIYNINLYAEKEE